jgi:predicted MFS family arabinose efflux permease
LESLKQIKRSRNLWLFFAAYCIFYGTLITFAVNSNFIFKPYGYSDLLISVNTVILMVFGIIGSILLSLYLKKTLNYRRALLTMVLGSALMMILLTIWMNTVKQKVITTFIVGMLGLAGNPIVTLCYELGAELCFPMS